MIELGREIAERDMAVVNSSAIGKADLIDRLLPLAAELQLQKSNASDKIAPLTARQDVLSSLDKDPSRRERLVSIQDKLATKFTCEDRQLVASDFGVVPVNSQINGLYDCVILTTPESLKTGATYNEIMDDSEENTANYTVNIDGEAIDTRQAMTEEVARAMGLHALALFAASIPKGFKPSRNIINQVEKYKDQIKDYKPPLATWLTGETSPQYMHTSVAPCAPLALNPTVTLKSRTGRWSTVGMRPGVIVPV